MLFLLPVSRKRKIDTVKSIPCMMLIITAMIIFNLLLLLLHYDDL